MTLFQLFAFAIGASALLHLFIRPRWLVIGATAIILTLYEIAAMRNALPTAGGASMWPIGAFFVLVSSAAGATIGAFMVSTIRKRKG